MKRDARSRGSDKPDRATYVYCLVAGERPPAVPRTLAGVPGSGPVRLLEVRPGRWLVASDVPLRKYDEAAIQRGLSNLEWVSRAAVAHERVVETFIDQLAVVPMKLFTIFRNDDRALANVRSAAHAIEETIKRVAGQHEWTVRVARVRAAVAEQPTSGGSGAGYLTRKKALRDARARDARGVREAAAEALDDLSAIATNVRRRPKAQVPAATPLLLDAAFLLPRNRRGRFRAAAARWARRLGEHGCEVTLTGPWPVVQLHRELSGMARSGSLRSKSRSKADEVFEPADSTLLDVLDNLLTRGVLLDGDVTLGLAGVDLVYIRLSALLAAADRVLPQLTSGRRVSVPRNRRTPRVRKSRSR